MHMVCMYEFVMCDCLRHFVHVCVLLFVCVCVSMCVYSYIIRSAYSMSRLHSPKLLEIGSPVHANSFLREAPVAEIGFRWQSGHARLSAGTSPEAPIHKYVFDCNPGQCSYFQAAYRKDTLSRIPYPEYLSQVISLACRFRLAILAERACQQVLHAKHLHSCAWLSSCLSAMFSQS